MKKLCVFAVLVLAAASAVWAQTKITTTIETIVPQLFRLAPSIVEIATLNLAAPGNMTLGSVEVDTNTKGTWIISIQSQNKGKLLGESRGIDDLYPYFFSFGPETAIDLSADYHFLLNTATNQSTSSFPIGVSYLGLENQAGNPAAGVYRDVITISILVP
jgi:hypothetical protein